MATDSVKKTILVVEDEIIVSQDIKKILEEFGYEVIGTPDSGEEAAKIFRARRPDLILMDIKLKGGMDGVRTAKEAGEIGIPVIFLTAYMDKKTVESAKAAKPYGYLSKPFNEEELCASIEMIFARLNAEDKLKKSEESFKNFFNHINSGAAIYVAIDDGQDFIFKDINEAGQKISRVKKEDVVGRRITESFPGVDEMGLLDVIRRVWKTGNPESLLFSLYKDKRLQQWVDNYVFKLPGGEAVAVYQDVSAYKEKEVALRESQERYEFIIDKMKELVFIVSKTGEIIFTNKSVQTISGYSAEELVGSSLAKFLTEDSLKVALLALGQEFLGIHYRDIEVKVKIKSGETRVLELYEGSNFVKEKGKTIGILVTGRDVTEGREAEKKLLQRNQELEEFNRLTIGRETKMIELKQRVKELESQLEKLKK